MQKNCSICNAPFRCGATGGGPCWCSTLPAAMTPVTDRDCECPDCLARTVAAALDALIDDAEEADVLAFAGRFRGGELIEHIDYEIEEGNYVFTRWFHLKRGTCCGNGCRNCPFDHVNVMVS